MMIRDEQTKPTEDSFAQIVRAELDAGEMPESVRERLTRTYECLQKIPQEHAVSQHGKPRKKMRRGALVVGIAAACAMFAGAAFAVGNFVQMGTGDASFFAQDKNLPVFDSMETGARALSAQVGQTAHLDGIEMTLDSISCDRSVANLYLTLRKPGGFSMEELANYAASEEGEWAKLQGALPVLRYTLTDPDGGTASGDVRRLDAYQEDDAVKCLMRIVPEKTMTEAATLSLEGFNPEDGESIQVFEVGLDLSTVPAPRGLGLQAISFDTEQGAKTLSLERFTVSELGCVMVTRDQSITQANDEGKAAEGLAVDAFDPNLLKVSDDAGNILHPVSPGDGLGVEDGGATIIEFAGISPETRSVTFTPVLENEAAMEADRLARVAAIEAGKAVNDDAVAIDVLLPGACIPLTDLGGYEVTGWNVEGSVVSIAMMPYGWVPANSAPELIPDREVTMLGERWVDPETGESGVGYHSAIRYDKWDYATGNLVQIDAYYQANAEELSTLTSYHAPVLPSGCYSEDSSASRSFELSMT